MPCVRVAAAAAALPTLTRAVASAQIEDYSLVSFVPLNMHKEHSVELALSHIDHAMQFGEDAEPKELQESDLVGDSSGVFDMDPSAFDKEPTE
jgi:hypothetical protein